MYKRVYDVCMLFSEQNDLHYLLLKIFIAHPQDENILLHVLPMVNFLKLCYVHS